MANRAFVPGNACLQHAQHEAISLTSAAEAASTLLIALANAPGAVDSAVQVGARDLADYFRLAIDEIAAIHPDEASGVDIRTAVEELGAVVGSAESATHTILGAAEQLDALGASLPKKEAAKVAAITTAIYEASNFQDLTGQRLAKVCSILRGIEATLAKLTAAVGYEPDPDASPRQREGDDGLLNGPGLPHTSNAQEDIDALFD